MNIKWDWTISAGNILTAVLLFIGFYAAHQQNIKKLQDLVTKVDMMFDWFKDNVIGRRGQR